MGDDFCRRIDAFIRKVMPTDLMSHHIKHRTRETNPKEESLVKQFMKKVQGNTRHPVSLNESNISHLLNEEYFVCEKTDGKNCRLFFINSRNHEENGVYLWDRRNITRRMLNADKSNLQLGTYDAIFECEAIVCSKLQIEFWLFDCSYVHDRIICFEDLSTRLLNISLFLMHIQTHQNFSSLDICFKLKEFFTLQNYSSVLQRIQSKCDNPLLFPENTYMSRDSSIHANDGIIFTPLRNSHPILKHKPLETIDFMIVDEILCVLHESTIVPFEWKGTPAHFDSNVQLETSVSSLERKIVECYHTGNNKWKAIRIRQEDKKNPNKKATAESIMKLIETHLCSGKNLNRVNVAFCDHKCFIFDNIHLCQRLGLL